MLISPHSRIRSDVILCLACTLLLVAPLCIAQNSSTTRKLLPRIEGTVRDDGGAAVPGALLRLERERATPAEAAAPVATTRSDEDGKYVLVAPSPGRYILRASQDGFAVLVVNAITLEEEGALQMNLQLHVWRGGGPTVEPLAAAGAAVPPVQFSDDSTFAIAGVTDRSNMGLHGSDANVRTADQLAKEAAALKSTVLPNAPPTSGTGDAHRLAGDASEKSGHPLDAVKEFEAAVRADPSEENYFAWGAELLLHRAGQAAVQVFGKAAQAFPQSPRLLAGLGAAYYAVGQFNEAAAEMCRASDLNPGDSQPYLFLGNMEQAAAEPLPCGEEKLARFAHDQPRNAYANFYYGLVLCKKARKSQDSAGLATAETYLRKAIAIDPALAEVYLELGLLYNARGEKPAALAAFQEAVAVAPQLSSAHYQLSLAYRRAGNLTKSELELKKYQKLRSSEDAQLEKERREMRQFVTVLQDGKASQP